MTAYHDAEWGTPTRNDKKICRAFFLDTFQAGLSWAIILSKRENFARAFKNFDPATIAKFSQKDAARLAQNPGIIRNRLKIEAAIRNARLILGIQKEHGSFAKYLWSFVGKKAKQRAPKKEGEIPATSTEAQALARDLKSRGFKFTGPTTVYAFMQGIGMVNDHLVSCFRYKEIKTKNALLKKVR